MRAFISIELPQNIKDILYDIQKQVGHGNAKINWVAKRNLHLTLKFFRDISLENADKIKSLLKKVKFKPFKIKFDKMGFFPDVRNVRVIWVGLKPIEDIMNLQGDVDERLSPFFSRENQFKAHLTLGRVKFVKKKKEFFEKLNEIEVPSAEFKVSEIKFYESRLTKDGPVYKLLK